MTVPQFRENVSEALDSIARQKGRAFLTVLGVVIGVASVTAVAAIIEGLNRDIVGRVQQLGSKVFFVGRFPGGQPPSQWTEEIRLRKKFTYEDGAKVAERCPSCATVTVFADRSYVFGAANEIRFRDQSSTSFLFRGVDQDFDDAFPMAGVQAGRFITQTDHEHARSVAVIGEAVAQALFGPLDPVGQTVRLNGLAFEVIGVFLHDEGLFGGPGLDDFVMIPYGKFRKLYPEVDMHYMVVAVDDTSQLGRAVDETTAALRQIRRVKPGDPNDFELTLPDFLEKLWSQLTGALFLLTFAVSSIALAVGGIGVMNIMLVSVTERSREIGIRKAVGARAQDIRLQFLVEALVLTTVGGVLGIATGWALSLAASAAFPAFSAYLSPTWILVGFLVSFVTGLFFGYYPAARAAKMDPIECLRYE